MRDIPYSVVHFSLNPITLGFHADWQGKISMGKNEQQSDITKMTFGKFIFK